MTNIAYDILILIIIPLLIFGARVLDVTLGTIRIVYISKRMKYLASLFGFFEVVIWLLAIAQIMLNLTNIFYYIAYAAGYAVGNYVGIYVESKIMIGKYFIKIISSTEVNNLESSLREMGFATTKIKAESEGKDANIIFVIIQKKYLQKVKDFIYSYNPKALLSVDELQTESDFSVGKVKRRFRGKNKKV